MENNHKTQNNNPSKKQETPDLSNAREQFEKEVGSSEIGAEMLDYGQGGPGSGRDDSSTRSGGSTNETPTSGSDVDTGAGVGSTD